jgi:hypothetical protein
VVHAFRQGIEQKNTHSEAFRKIETSGLKANRRFRRCLSCWRGRGDRRMTVAPPFSPKGFQAPKGWLMRIVKVLHRSRVFVAPGMLGLLSLAGGCGSDPNTQPPAPPTTQAQQDAEREARQKAYGKAAIPPSKR